MKEYKTYEQQSKDFQEKLAILKRLHEEYRQKLEEATRSESRREFLGFALVFSALMLVNSTGMWLASKGQQKPAISPIMDVQPQRTRHRRAPLILPSHHFIRVGKVS